MQHNTIIRLPVDALSIDPLNARQTPLRPDDPGVIILAHSLREIGQLQPIVVRPDPDLEGKYFVVIGWRRVLATRYNAQPDILAMLFHYSTDDRSAAASAAENMVRKDMHPVDCWLSIARLCDDHGCDPEIAARAVGLDPLLVPRMRHLARMSPAMLQAMRASPAMPTMPQLRHIAAASHAVQDGALERHGDQVLHWDRIAGACKTTRIGRSRAIFDADASGLVWQEDWLAAPDDPDRFTTEDISGFLAAQRAALAAQAKSGRGRVHVCPVTETGSLVLPEGWMRCWDDIPRRFGRDDPRQVFKAIVPAGDAVGEVIAILAEPVPQRAQPTPAAPQQAPARPPITKVAQRLLAEKQAEGVTDALPIFFEGMSGPLAPRGLQALLGVFLFDNVSIAGGHWELRQEIARVLADPAPSTADMLTLVQRIVARALVFQAPDVFTHSGKAAHLFARMVGACIPRCDTAEILKGVSLTVLQTIAREHGIADHGTATQLRQRLVGQAPNWRPTDYATPPADVPGDESAEELDTAAE